MNGCSCKHVVKKYSATVRPPARASNPEPVRHPQDPAGRADRGPARIKARSQERRSLRFIAQYVFCAEGEDGLVPDFCVGEPQDPVVFGGDLKEPVPHGNTMLAWPAASPDSSSTGWLARVLIGTAYRLGHRIAYATAWQILIAAGIDSAFEDCGLRVLRPPPQAPRANATCERLIGTLRRELLDQILIINQQPHKQVSGRYLKTARNRRPGA